MRVIYKQTIPIRDAVPVFMPRGSEIIHAGEQRGQLCIWYKCDDTRPDVQRTIHIAGTGHDLGHLDQSSAYYFTTVQMSNGLVWHLFLGREDV